MRAREGPVGTRGDPGGGACRGAGGPGARASRSAGGTGGKRPGGPILVLLLVVLYAAPAPGVPALFAQEREARPAGGGGGPEIGGLVVTGYRAEPDSALRESGFDVFVARLRARGSVAPGFEYDVQTGLGGRSDGPAAGRGLELLDARLSLPVQRALTVSAGRFKVPFSEEELRGRGQISLLQRAQAVEALAPGRDVGVELSGSFLEQRLAYRAGLFNGEGGVENPDGRPLYAARVVYNSVGPVEFYDELMVQVGASLVYARDGGTDLSSAGRWPATVAGDVDLGVFEGDRLLLGLDTRLSYGGVFAAAEYVRGRFDPEETDAVDAGPRSSDGGYVEAGYSLWGALDLLARYDTHRAVGDERRSFLVLGANLYAGLDARLGFQVAAQTSGPALPVQARAGVPGGGADGSRATVPGGLADGQALIRLQVGF